MSRVLTSVFIALIVAGCSSLESPGNQNNDAKLLVATSSSRSGVVITNAASVPPPTLTVTATATPSPNAVQTALMVLEFDRATSTAIAAETGTKQAAISTEKSEATQSFWINVTFAVSTERSEETKVAKTETAGTKQAEYRTAVPITETARIATQTIESDKLMAERVQIWMIKIGGVLIGIVSAGIALYFAFIGIRAYDNKKQAEVFTIKTDALKPDSQGRRAGILTSEMKPGERLIIPDLAHRSLIDPASADDLTTEQALSNASDQRKLEVLRTLSQSPVMPAMLRRMADSYVKQTAADIQITKPEQAPTMSTDNLLETSDYPALPTPHFKQFFAWDGHLRPYGVDEQGQLMLVDPARRPHLMVTGASRSGKTRSSIRILVAGALASGWNVVTIGKKVDFLPFEDHPNFKIMPVNVRKDAERYAYILRTLAEQMDLRDALMSSKGVSTWDLYGAPQTMVVLDDFSGAMFAMHKSIRQEVLNEAKVIAMDGGKFGLNLVIGLQRASWTSIDTDLRSQMGRIVYRVESAGDSRIALDEDGAERLPYLNFLSRLSDNSTIQHGVGFFLQDVEVEAFLRSRPVPENEPLEWVDAETAEDTVEQNEPSAPSASNEERAKILELHHQGKKPSVIIREIWGITGGGSYSGKSELVKSVTSSSSSSSEHEVPQNGHLHAV